MIETNLCSEVYFENHAVFFPTLQLIIEFSKALKQLFLNSVTGTHGVTWAPSSGR